MYRARPVTRELSKSTLSKTMIPFSPFEKFIPLRLFLAIVSIEDLELYQVYLKLYFGPVSLRKTFNLVIRIFRFR